MKIKNLIIILIIIFIVFVLPLCTTTRIKSFSITDVNVQRIEFDSCQIDKNFYMVNLTIDFHKGLGIRLPFHMPYIEPKDNIDSIIITDASGKLTKEMVGLLNGIDKNDNNIYIYQDHADSSNTKVPTDLVEDWVSVQKHMNIFYRGTLENFIFYTDKDKPLPETFILKFKDREIRTKVNNTPKHVLLEKESELICDSGKVRAVHKEDK